MKLSGNALAIVYREMCANIPERDARWIIQKRTAYNWADISAKPESILSQQQLELVAHDYAQRLNGTPLSRIYNHAEFWGLKFQLSENTLDPRPETELIIDLSKKHFARKSPEMILDLGTGSGCILIALLHEFKSSTGCGVDLSEDALAIARINAEQNHVAARANFCCSDWTDSVAAKFDLVVSNPPYIGSNVIPQLSAEVREYDPILALDGGKDGLEAYRKIFSSLKNILTPSGIAFFEIGYDQGESVPRLAEEYGLSVHHVHPDLAGLARVVEISRGDK